MYIWNDNDVTWIVDPPFRRNECRDFFILKNDVTILLIVCFVASELTPEWAKVMSGFMVHKCMYYNKIGVYMAVVLKISSVLLV